MKIEASTPDEFFAAAGEREPALRELDELIRESAPSLNRELHSGMSITMLGYGTFHYKTKSGSEGDWPAVAIAPQKNYISLYICAVNENGEYLAEANKEKLGKVSCGKSCIRFKKIEDLNKETVRELLKDIEAKVKMGQSPFGFA